jgi:hypothetical protein
MPGAPPLVARAEVAPMQQACADDPDCDHQTVHLLLPPPAPPGVECPLSGQIFRALLTMSHADYNEQRAIQLLYFSLLLLGGVRRTHRPALPISAH